MPKGFFRPTLLVGRTPPNLEVFLLKPPSARVPEVVYSSESLASKSACIRSHILFLHAFTGCDTTSAFFSRGKLKFCELFAKSDDLHGFAEIFKKTHVAMDTLIDHGLRLALALYGAPKDLCTKDEPAIQLVQKYRAKSYTAAADLQKVDLARIIPTANALTEHIKRVYFQVQAWYGSQAQVETLNPVEWGWEIVGGELSPVTMTQEAGPEEILSKISCSCQTDCGPRCGCRRNGLECSLACKHCDGNCSNQKDVANEAESSDEEEDEGGEENDEGEEEEEFEQDV